MAIEVISAEQYAIERALCDKANAYIERVTQGKRNSISAVEATHPDYAACDNDMRGRIEQYELFRDAPSVIVAYIDVRHPGSSNCYAVTVWPCLPIGHAYETARWRVNSFIGTYMHQYRMTFQGKRYTGRGFGTGMAIVFRETAASKRGK